MVISIVLEKSLKDVRVSLKIMGKMNLALRHKIAKKHGRNYTGRKRGIPKNLVGADGKRLVTKRPAGSEEEEEEEEE
jgi:hypothetical protein